MNPTEETKTLPTEMQRWVKLARILAGVGVASALAVAPALTAYRSAAEEARSRAQNVKDKSEAGYQVTKEAMQALDKRIADLESSVRQLLGQQHPAARRGSRPRPITPPAPPVPAKALPNDLDKAKEQVYKGAAAAAVPARDGSTVNHER